MESPKKKGIKVVVRDKMQNYTYYRIEKAGKNFDPRFTPAISPKQMLKMGVFEGKYMNDGNLEFPGWLKLAKISPVANASINYFGIKSRLSLQEWQKRGWVPVAPGDKDIRGWFQWYCRYWSGRRLPIIDEIQIKRWRSFKRHSAQVQKSATRDGISKKDIMSHRPKQRQALLQWAYDPFIIA